MSVVGGSSKHSSYVQKHLLIVKRSRMIESRVSVVLGIARYQHFEELLLLDDGTAGGDPSRLHVLRPFVED